MNIPSEENPDDRPQPQPCPVNNQERSNEEREMERLREITSRPGWWWQSAQFIAAARTAVPSLLDRLAAVERERDELRERLGECIGCNYNDGPDECCPHHGRTVTEWIDIASDRIGAANDLRTERDAALARIAAVEAERDEAREQLAMARTVADELFLALLAARQSAWPDMMPALVDHTRGLSITLNGVLAASPTPTAEEQR